MFINSSTPPDVYRRFGLSVRSASRRYFSALLLSRSACMIHRQYIKVNRDPRCRSATVAIARATLGGFFRPNRSIGGRSPCVRQVTRRWMHPSQHSPKNIPLDTFWKKWMLLTNQNRQADVFEVYHVIFSFPNNIFTITALFTTANLDVPVWTT